MLLTPLYNPIPVYNVDRTQNSTESITHTAEVTDLRKNMFILEFFLLKCHNPDIDWTKGMLNEHHSAALNYLY